VSIPVKINSFSDEGYLVGWILFSRQEMKPFKRNAGKQEGENLEARKPGGMRKAGTQEADR
jgi:hypothetical protein